MAFTQSQVATPTAIGGVKVTLYKPGPNSVSVIGGPATESGDFAVQVTYSDGSSRVVSGNLVPHLSQAQISALLSFMQDMYNKAVDEILP